MKRAFVVLAASVLVAVPAFPCGGPGADIVDLPLVPTGDYLAHTLYDDDYEVELRPELRWLEPVRRTMPDSVARLNAFLYEGSGYPIDATTDTTGARVAREMQVSMLRAIDRGAFSDASTAAREVVNRVLDTPAGLAAVYGEALRNAVEIIDVVPRLVTGDRDVAARYFRGDSATREVLERGGALPAVLREALEVRNLTRASAATYADAHPGSVRLPALRFVALQEAMRLGIPDGWASNIRDSVPAERWNQLEQLHNEWLSQFATHPLADYVRLSKVRLYYFKGDASRAWDELLGIYPRHRERVLGEMRYLVRVSTLPASLDDPRIDWPLRSVLVPYVPLTKENWTAYWKASALHSREAWAIPMQERLLWRSIETIRSTGILPDGFPTRPRAPSQLWAKLRLIALLDAGDVNGAFAQLDSTADSVADVPAIRVRLHLIRRDWHHALAASPVRDPSTAYLVRVLAPPSIVDSLAASRHSPLAVDARLTIAGHRAVAGDWAGASRAASGTAQARLWAKTAMLASDTSRPGLLAFARWMRDRRGVLFFGDSTYWLRGLNWRLYALRRDTADRSGPPPKLDTRLPWTAADERAKITAHFESTTELYYALRAYARWLDGGTASTPGLAAVVREADQVYNRLLNWDATNSTFWSDMLPTSAEARSIRRAGALLRQR